MRNVSFYSLIFGGTIMVGVLLISYGSIMEAKQVMDTGIGLITFGCIMSFLKSL